MEMCGVRMVHNMRRRLVFGPGLDGYELDGYDYRYRE